ncbi:unnamed protein product [Vicia faba]|uniref:Uncharacterized protein n=1 Tax=Vicia faba TaxID=3906 RepID=A0AAV1AX64_VICFA|nr:unnamed protein product [Vicia faba]
MAKASNQQASSDEEFSNSSSSSEEEQVNPQINKEEYEEELEAVARVTSSDNDEVTGDNLVDPDEDAAAEDADNDEQRGDDDAPKISKREKARGSGRHASKVTKKRRIKILD